MKSRKLTQLLILFQLDEWKAFQEFLELTDLNVRPKHRDIFAYIKDYFWSEIEEQKARREFPSKSLLQKHYFPKQEEDYQQLNKALSVLHLLLKQFLLLKHLAKNPHQLDLITIGFAIDREQFHYAQTALNKAQNDLSKQTYNGYELHLLSEEEDRLQFTQNHRNRTETLQKVNHTLDDFYFTSKLKNYCLQLNRAKARNASAPKIPPIFEAALAKYCSIQENRPVLFQMYYQAFQLLKGIKPENALKKLSHFIAEHKSQMKIGDLNIIQEFIFNHYNSLLNLTDETNTILNHYKKLINEKTLIRSDGSLRTSHYRNIVLTAIKAKDYDYVEQFTQTHKDLIAEEDRESASNYNLSSNEFAQKKWLKAIDYALKIDANNPTFKFSRGSLLIRSAYEYELSLAGEDPKPNYTFEKMFNNFKAQLHRKQPRPSDQLKAYRNFVYFTHRLYKLSYKIKPQQQKQALKLQKKMKDTRLLAVRLWLTEKLNLYLPKPSPSHS